MSPLLQRSILAALLMGVITALITGVVLSWPWWVHVEIGDLLDRPYLTRFHAAEYQSEQQLGFRWSQPEAALVLPGAGRLAPLTLRVHGDYPAMPLVLDDGHDALHVSLRPGWQQLHLLPVSDPWSGDVQLNIQTPPQVTPDDPRERGVVLDWLRLHGSASALLPLQAALAGMAVGLTVMLISWSLRRVWAGMVGAGILLAFIFVVLTVYDGAWRLLFTVYSGRLVLVLLLGGLLALAAERVQVWLASRGLPAPNALARRGVAAAVLLSFVLRFGGMAYPLTFISDLRFNLARAPWCAMVGCWSFFCPTHHSPRCNGKWM
ncbi:MAG: hypothetical protein HC837_09525 [Chloroflexaceae bacterium]|nr:hypothetical protein [Chloroflexaceae bacterium]